ncbi:MAG: EamA family transporter [Parcubacteria group bacterium]|jgi:drug/metabolite transporter (DMT)-like permease
MWIIYSLLGAFFQASEMAIKKKALKTKGMNNFIAFLAFLLAGFLMSAFFILQNESLDMFSLSSRFWIGLGSSVAVNILATYFLYKALDLSELSYLMPYMTLTSLTIMFPPMLLFHEFPSTTGLAGILVVVSGAFLMEYGRAKKSEAEILQHQQNRKGLLFFLMTAACYTLSPTTTKLAVLESSPLFATMLIHLLMGLVFGIFILLFKETTKIKNVFVQFQHHEKRNFFIAIILASLSITISNLSIGYAYALQNVAYIMAIKRIMPFFAFLIGYFYFKERTHVQRKIWATLLMVAGAVIITLFK